MFVFKRSKYLLLENIRNSKTYLNKLEYFDLENPEHKAIFQSLVDKLQKMPNLVYFFTSKLWQSGGVIRSEKWDLAMSIIDWIIANKQIVGQLPRNIIEFHSLEDLEYSISTLETSRKAGKFYKGLYKKMRDQIRSLDTERKRKFDSLAVKFMNLNRDYQSTFTPLKYFELHDIDIITFINSLEKFVLKEDVNKEKKRIFGYVKRNPTTVELVWNQNNILVLKVDGHKSLCKVGAEKWCIVYDTGYYERYLDVGKLNTQYVIHDFNLPASHRYSMFGLTIGVDGKIYDESSATQDRYNNNVGFEKILKLTGIPREVFISKYREEIEKLKLTNEEIKKIIFSDKSSLSSVLKYICDKEILFLLNGSKKIPIDIISIKDIQKYYLDNTLNSILDLLDELKKVFDYDRDFYIKLIENWEYNWIPYDRYRVDISSFKNKYPIIEEFIELIISKVQIRSYLFESLFDGINDDFIEIILYFGNEKIPYSIVDRYIEYHTDSWVDYVPNLQSKYIDIVNKNGWEYILDILDKYGIDSSVGYFLSKIEFEEINMELVNNIRIDSEELFERIRRSEIYKISSFNYFINGFLSGELLLKLIRDKDFDIYHVPRVSIFNLSRTIIEYEDKEFLEELNFLLQFEHLNNFLNHYKNPFLLKTEKKLSGIFDNIETLFNDIIKHEYIFKYFTAFTQNIISSNIEKYLKLNKKLKFHQIFNLIIAFRFRFDIINIDVINKYGIIDTDQLLEYHNNIDTHVRLIQNNLMKLNDTQHKIGSNKIKEFINLCMGIVLKEYLTNFNVYDIISKKRVKKFKSFEEYAISYEKLAHLLEDNRESDIFNIDSKYNFLWMYAEDIIGNFASYEKEEINPKSLGLNLFDLKNISIYDYMSDKLKGAELETLLQYDKMTEPDRIDDENYTDIVIKILTKTGFDFDKSKNSMLLYTLSKIPKSRKEFEEKFFSSIGLQKIKQSGNTWIWKTDFKELGNIYWEEVDLENYDEWWGDREGSYSAYEDEIKEITLDNLEILSYYFKNKGFEIDITPLEKYDIPENRNGNGFLKFTHRESVNIYNSDQDIRTLLTRIDNIFNENTQDDYDNIDIEELQECFDRSWNWTDNDVRREKWWGDTIDNLKEWFEPFPEGIKEAFGHNMFIWDNNDSLLVRPKIWEIMDKVDFSDLRDYTDLNNFTFDDVFSYLIDISEMKVNIAEDNGYVNWKDEDYDYLNERFGEEIHDFVGNLEDLKQASEDGPNPEPSEEKKNESLILKFSNYIKYK